MLNKVQTNTLRSLFNLHDHKKRIVNAFQQALTEQAKKITMANELLTNAVLSGSDFTDLPNKNVAAFARRLHGFSQQDAPYFNTIYDALDRTSATFSAIASAYLVEIDFLGKVIGSELAMLTINSSLSESLSSTVLPGLLVLTFIYNELNEFFYDYCWKYDKKIGLDTIFYPLVSGVMNAIHEECTTVAPKIATVNNSLRKASQDSVQKDTSASDNTIFKKVRAFFTAIRTDWTKSWQAAKKYYTKYDKEIIDTGLEKALQKNPTASKRLLSCRKAFLRIMGNCQDKKYLHGMMQIILTFRPAILTLQLFTSKAIFATTKHVTGFSLKTLGSLSNLAQNLRQKPIPPITPTEQNEIDTQPNLTTTKSSH